VAGKVELFWNPQKTKLVLVNGEGKIAAASER